MGKPKQRSRLSTGFAAEIRVQRELEQSRARQVDPSASVEVSGSVPITTTVNSDIVNSVKPFPAGRLKTLNSGKIKKAKKQNKSNKLLANLTLGQVFNSATTIQRKDDKLSNSSSIRDSDSKTPLDVKEFVEGTRKQMKLRVRSKKDRQLIKKEVFRKRVEDLKSEEKSKRERKARQKTVIVGDMLPILDALPSVSSLDDDIQNLINQCQQSTQSKTKSKRKLSMKRRNEEM